MSKFCAFLSRAYLIEVLAIADVQEWFEKLRTKSSGMMEHFFEKQGRTVTKGDVMFVNTRKILNKKHVTLLNKHGFYLTKWVKKPSLEQWIGHASPSMGTCRILSEILRISERRRSASELTEPIFLKGDETRERCHSLQHFHVVCSTLWNWVKYFSMTFCTVYTSWLCVYRFSPKSSQNGENSMAVQ